MNHASSGEEDGDALDAVPARAVVLNPEQLGDNQNGPELITRCPCN